IPQVKTARLDHLVQLDHDLLDDLVARQQGAIFVTGHFGNWEMINLTLGRLGYPLVGVAVKQKGAGGRYVEWVREQTDARFIDRKASTREMLRLIKSGHFLGLVNDQDALRHGVRIEFFGQPSSRFKGAAMFALQTGLPVVFGACLMGPGNRYKITFAPISTDNLPDDRDEAIRELTQRINSQLERAIKDHPEQYFWFHRMWKSQLQ
ncbi:MAG: lysophospholipid acyltransferase family protein, partial [Candidatus Marinimicrobia bacterium]|nr:lysophospholipid acyltransferase family protein [Candidatus Neomarinimicrobiota bacterium]